MNSVTLAPHLPPLLGAWSWGPTVHPVQGRPLAVSHLSPPREIKDLEGGAWVLPFCVPDPRFMHNHQEVPSENSSSVEISISTGSQEMPHSPKQHVRAVCAMLHLKYVCTCKVLGSVWLRDGPTQSAAFPGGVHPTRGTFT